MSELLELLNEYARLEKELAGLDDKKQAIETSERNVESALFETSKKLMAYIKDNQEYVLDAADGETYIVRRSFTMAKVTIKKAERIVG